MKLTPKISIVFPVYNSSRTIRNVLRSIYKQKYPLNKIEVIIVDDHSTDNTLEIARQFPVRILSNDTHDPEKGKLIGLKKSTGEFFTYIESDLYLKSKRWIELMLQPLESDPNIVATFTKYYPHKDESIINSYLNVDPLQRDALHRFFTPGVEKVIFQKKKDYFYCIFEKDKIPPMGLCVYRKSILEEIYKEKKAFKDRFLELDNLVILSEKGYKVFAYVPTAGYYHFHINGIKDFISKRKRNLMKVFLPDEEERKFRWIETNSFKGKIKIVTWIIYSESFILPFFVGCFRAIKYKKFSALLEGFLAWIETNVLVWSLIKDERGRKFLLKSFFGK